VKTVVCEHDFVTVKRKDRYLAQCKKCKFYIKAGQKRRWLR
jgi:hypothetical protein